MDEDVKEVRLGENKAINRLYYDSVHHKLGIVILVPTSFDPEENRTYYKPIAAVVSISPAERDEIVRMLGGVVVKPATEDPGSIV